LKGPEGPRVYKEYLPFRPSRKDLGAVDDIYLSADSDPRRSSAGSRLEGKLLMSFRDQIPKEKLLLPYLFRASQEGEKPRFVEMERIVEETHHEKILEAIRAGQNPISAIGQLPQALAAIHNQLNYQRGQSGKPMQDILCSEIRELTFRDYRNQLRRLSHYFCIIAYSVSPDLSWLPVECQRKWGSAQNNASGRYVETISLIPRVNGIRGYVKSKIMHYLNEKYKKSAASIFEDIVTRDFIIKFGVSPSSEEAYTTAGVNSLRKQGKMIIIEGDLNPKHVFVNGRYIDLDEARLGAAEIDLSSLIYSMHLYPRGSHQQQRQQEAELLELCVKGYFEPMWEHKYEAGIVSTKKPSAKDRAGFVIRLGEARLMEMIRLLAVTCKTRDESLAAFTKGHPVYEALPSTELRAHILNNCFTEGGLLPFMEFWGQREGKRALDIRGHELTPLFDQQIRDVEDLFDKSGIMKCNLDQKTLCSLDALMS